jgi:hypothetical protein
LTGTDQLLYSTFLGGDGAYDGVFDLVVGSSGAVTLTGYTGSSDFPVTPDAPQPFRGGSHDAFVTRLNPEGNGAADLQFSTFLGGSSLDYSLCVAHAGPDHVVVAGVSCSDDFPVTMNAYDDTHGGGDIYMADGTICRLEIGGPPLELFVRGDCNADGFFDIGDPIFTLNFLFSDGDFPTCDDACDANDDGGVDISDSIYVLAAQFSGGPSPLPPFSDCGVDPTDDTLDCGAFSFCP